MGPGHLCLAVFSGFQAFADSISSVHMAWLNSLMT